MFSKSISQTLIGLIPMSAISIFGGPLHFLPSQTGPPGNIILRRCICKYILLFIFLTLKITAFSTYFFGRMCKHSLPLHYSYSLRVYAILDHFRYPAPHLDQWQQRIWYDLGATQEVLHQMCSHLSRGLPMIASPLRAESPPPSRRPATVLICPSHGGKFS